KIGLIRVSKSGFFAVEAKDKVAKSGVATLGFAVFTGRQAPPGITAHNKRMRGPARMGRCYSSRVATATLRLWHAHLAREFTGGTPVPLPNRTINPALFIYALTHTCVKLFA